MSKLDLAISEMTGRIYVARFGKNGDVLEKTDVTDKVIGHLIRHMEIVETFEYTCGAGTLIFIPSDQEAPNGH
ncbi:hypothetical protein VE23_25115 [Paenibacillus sp. D9]|uniref:DUF7446 family protein n=1 Tax=Paenibacillus sp. D9 TaxID=665792 RepID=UPI00061E485D|nr:hypothetical protein [Paenibacillus sp. D9]KKC45839.1 hypothetical protein VE23_25295 [Paenibacillus sp. D9]KKC49573.1 hypothetical protein VE23_25115 [Paenibacillus sp. D9]